jgi:hypothetical protein
MSRYSRSSFCRRALTGAGLMMSAAGLTTGLAAQTTRTGWEDVKPTGWPASAAPKAAPAPRTADVASAAPAPRPARASRSSRRRSRSVAPRRPAAPSWITLEWDAPPPLDVALDWRPAPLDARAVRFVVAAPDVAPNAWDRAALDAADAANAATEAQLPATALIRAAAPAPAAPRPAAFSRATANDPATPGFRAFMNRLANALGLRRQAPADTAPRIARAEGESTR